MSQKPPKRNADTDVRTLLQTMDLLHIRSPDDWLSLKQATQGYPDVKQVEDKLNGLLGSHNISVVIERHYIDKDYRDSHSAY